jgi:hypothetical protein
MPFDSLMETSRMSDTATLGIGAFASDGSGPRSAELIGTPTVRAASVVKPLLFWAAANLEPLASDVSGWEALARPSVTVSDNDATARLWATVGEEQLVDELAHLAGVTWASSGEGEHPALRLMVTAGELANAYARFAADQGQPAQLIRRWMREVPSEQTFGLRSVAAATAGCPEASVGIKCGWFGLERAHAVVLVELDGRTLGATVTTTWPVSPADIETALTLSGDATALALAHDAAAGDAIRNAVRRGLEHAAEI